MDKKKEIESIEEDLKNISSLAVIGQTEGGKILVKSLVTDIIAVVDTLCSKHKELTTQEFVSLCAEMKTKIDMARVIDRAEGNKKYLEELLKETLTTE